MKLWLLKRTDGWGWDEHIGFVVRAETEEQARELAAEMAADEGAAMWTDPSQSRCECIGEGAGAPGILLDSFNAG